MEMATVSLNRSGGRNYCYEDVEWKVGVLSYEREESATALQEVLRGGTTRKRTLGELSRQEETAAIMIQATIEREMIRRVVRGEIAAEQAKVAVQIQAAIAGDVARKLARGELSEQEVEATLQIQAAIAGEIARKVMKGEISSVEAAATMSIQADISAHQVRRFVNGEIGAQDIQAVITGYGDRASCKAMRDQIEAEAASKLQAGISEHQSKISVTDAASDAKRGSATVVQGMIRGLKARQRIASVHQLNMEEEKKGPASSPPIFTIEYIWDMKESAKQRIANSERFNALGIENIAKVVNDVQKSRTLVKRNEVPRAAEDAAAKIAAEREGSASRILAFVKGKEVRAWATREKDRFDNYADHELSEMGDQLLHSAVMDMQDSGVNLWNGNSALKEIQNPGKNRTARQKLMDMNLKLMNLKQEGLDPSAEQLSESRRLHDEAAKLELEILVMNRESLDDILNPEGEDLEEKTRIVLSHPVPSASEVDKVDAVLETSRRLADFDEILAVIGGPEPTTHVGGNEGLMQVFGKQVTEKINAENQTFLMEMKLQHSSEYMSGVGLAAANGHMGTNARRSDLLKIQDKVSSDLENLRFSMLPSSAYLQHCLH